MPTPGGMRTAGLGAAAGWNDDFAALHAGERTASPALPEGLRFHIRESIERAHADRIGHGVSVMRAFLKTSEKARLEWEFERRTAAFERAR